MSPLTCTMVGLLMLGFEHVAAHAGEVNPMKERVTRMKKSVVRVITGDSMGTGFVVSSDGLIDTCSHVIRQLSRTADGKVNVSEAASITVEFGDGQKLPAQVHGSSRNAGLQESIARDFALLQV